MIRELLLAACGPVLDYITSEVGLRLGFYEANPHPWILGYGLIGVTGIIIMEALRGSTPRTIGMATIMETLVIVALWYPGLHNLLKLMGA